METGKYIDDLVDFLAVLSAVHQTHWYAHWAVKGSYGDHLLMQRLYEAIPAEMDALAEKIFAIGNMGDVVSPPFLPTVLAQRSLVCMAHLGQNAKTPLEVSLVAEQKLLDHVKALFDKADKAGVLSMGMNDFLSALASAHETHVYLLTQRLRYGTDPR